jgi:hypothetical protein
MQLGAEGELSEKTTCLLGRVELRGGSLSSEECSTRTSSLRPYACLATRGMGFCHIYATLHRSHRSLDRRVAFLANGMDLCQTPRVVHTVPMNIPFVMQT